MLNLHRRLKPSAFALSLIPILVFGHQANSPSFQTVGSAWDDLKLDSKVRLKLSFRNANIDNVIAVFENASQITIVKDPALKGPITLTTAKAVRLSEAFHVFNTVLKLDGYEFSRDGQVLVITKAKPPATRPAPR